MSRFTSCTEYSCEEVAHLEKEFLPTKIAIIMDGNRRWAKANGVSVEEGHRAGAETLVNLIRPAVDLGVKVITVYGFSTENWQRKKGEVLGLFRLIEEYLLREQIDAMQNRVCLDFVGDIEGLPEAVRDLCHESRLVTKDNDRARLVFALNYGGRAEILEGISSTLYKMKPKSAESEACDLPVVDMPYRDILDGSPDILIRTSGENRLSNYLLWHLPGVEYYAPDCFWPDFNRYELLRALECYQERKRKRISYENP